VASERTLHQKASFFPYFKNNPKCSLTDAKRLLKTIPELREPAGALVAALVASLPESEDDLAPGDLIISLNGKSVPNVEALREFLSNLQAGSPIVLQIQRQNELRLESSGEEK
jgi:S1-C subfamily serine protease